jgi:hypothetical protein
MASSEAIVLYRLLIVVLLSFGSARASQPARAERASARPAVASAEAGALSGPAAEWWKHVARLSDDSFNGRAAGTAEHRKAADYVAGEFKKLGLEPGGENGYLQPVPLQDVSVDTKRSKILVTGEPARELTINKEVIVAARGTCGNVDAPLAFVGHGLWLPELGHDDLAGVDLKGKVAVFTSGAPGALKGALVSHRQGTGERWRILHERGAIGTIVILDPKQPGGLPWKQAVAQGSLPTTGLAQHDEFGDRRISLVASEESSSVLKRPGAHLRANITCTASPTTSENVVAMLRGSDDGVRDEFVVLTAHIDHVGRFGTGADTIYNGTMDNAAGVASLIDAAARIKASGRTPRRSVAFVAVTAEERGLLGSQYFAANPSLPRGSRIVANINMDMWLPIIPMKSLIGWGMEESSLERDVEAAAESVGVKAERDPVPQMNPFIRSDQYSFVRMGVPSVMVAVGSGGDKDVWKTWEAWMGTRYHQPNDDAQQPVNMESAETFQRALVALITRVADAEQPPRWNTNSAFAVKRGDP